MTAIRSTSTSLPVTGLPSTPAPATTNTSVGGSVDAFQAAFTLIVGWAFLSCLAIALTRDTACQQAG